MPLYEYKCANCELQFEEIGKINDPEPVPCPECGGVSKRMISKVFGFSFSGSGSNCSSSGGG